MGRSVFTLFGGQNGSASVGSPDGRSLGRRPKNLHPPRWWNLPHFRGASSALIFLSRVPGPCRVAGAGIGSLSEDGTLDLAQTARCCAAETVSARYPSCAAIVQQKRADRDRWAGLRRATMMVLQNSGRQLQIMVAF